jgi:type IV pilus assembly protein PilN
MAKINLLPWREEQRKLRQRSFLSTMLGTVILGFIVVFIVITFYNQKIDHQMDRNNLIKSEIAKLEQRIKKIDELERTRERLITRKQIIERLQASRSMTVELMDNLAKSIPVGVTLITVRQQGGNLALVGSSQSNARVSAYLRELETNPLFLNPQLEYVRIAGQGRTQNPAGSAEPYQFSIKVGLRPPKVEEDDLTAAQVAGGAQ